MISMKIHDVQRQLARAYGKDHYYTKHYRREELLYSGPIHKWLAATLRRGDHVLDIGPGYGTLAAFAAQYTHTVHTLDVIPIISEQVALDFGLVCHIGNVEKGWCKEKYYQTIIMTEVLEHFNFHPRPTMDHIHTSLLHPEGRLYLSTPDADAGWGRCDVYPSLAAIPRYHPFLDHLPWKDQHIWQYTGGELLDLLDDAGFRVVRGEKSRSPGGGHLVLEAEIKPERRGL